MDILSAREAAKRLGFSREYVTQLCREGKLEAARVSDPSGSQRWVITASALAAFQDVHSPYGWRSPTRRLLENLMRDGQPRKIDEIVAYAKCSKVLVRKYLREIGCVQPSRGVWVLAQSEERQK